METLPRIIRRLPPPGAGDRRNCSKMQVFSGRSSIVSGALPGRLRGALRPLFGSARLSRQGAGAPFRAPPRLETAVARWGLPSSGSRPNRTAAIVRVERHAPLCHRYRSAEWFASSPYCCRLRYPRAGRRLAGMPGRGCRLTRRRN